MKKFYIFIIAFILMTIGINAQEWQPVGIPGFTKGEVDFGLSMVIDGKGIPYVIYFDNSFDKTLVMKYNGNFWVTDGNGGISAGTSHCLGIDSSSTPYVAYSPDFGDIITIIKYNGSDWVTLVSDTLYHENNGIGFGANCVSTGFDNMGIPYGVFQDSWINEDNYNVMKFDGYSWLNVGPTINFPTGVPTYIYLAFDSKGTPFMLLESGIGGNVESAKVTVMEYNDSNWVTLGSIPFVINLDASNVSIAIDKNGIPYLVYSDVNKNYKTTVMKYNDSNWVTVGNLGFTIGNVGITSIAIDNNGTPYVAFEIAAHGYKASVMKYNGSNWISVGNPGFSSDLAGDINISIDNRGTIYVAYQDWGDSGKVTVMSYVSSEGTQDISLKKELSIYPNPNNGHFTINYQQDNDIKGLIELLDVTERIVYTTNIKALMECKTLIYPI